MTPRQENKNKVRRWAGIRPSEEEIAQILNDHKLWIIKENYYIIIHKANKTEPPHDLSGAILWRAPFNNAELIGINLKGADLREAQLQGSELRCADLRSANLSHANLQKTDLHSANLENAHMEKANLSEANLIGVNLQKTNLLSAKLASAKLLKANLSQAFAWGADFQKANLRNANFERAVLWSCHFYQASLTSANIRQTDLQGADFSDADVTQVKYNYRSTWKWLYKMTGFGYLPIECRGIRAETCYGDPVFKRFVQDQDYLETFRARHRFLYWVWYILADCGRSFWPWVCWSILFALAFAALFTPYPEGFTGYPIWMSWLGYIVHGAWQGVCHAWEFLCGLLPQSWTGLFCDACGPIVFEHTSPTYGKGPQPVNFGSALYFSIVTFTTLGFGDVVAASRAARVLVGLEVIVGYVMLGGLVSILANKLARRS